VDLLVTDVVMPGMNGRELRDRLRERWPGLKCLFMSGYTANVIAHHGVLEEGVEFMLKPFTAQDFCQRVRQLLDAGAGSAGA
jgi:YesN/AraC family two-component response regulator